MHLILDISLTVAKPWLHAPSGIDRVEFAHARHWRARGPQDVTFVMRTAWDRLAALPDGLARDILAQAEAVIAPGLGHRGLGLRARPALAMAHQFLGGGALHLRRLLERRRDCVFLTVSCATLHKHPAMAALAAQGCRIAALVHDLIPLSHPHCFPAGEAARHAERMRGVSLHADAAIAVSDTTREAMQDWFAREGLRLPPVEVAHLGVDLPAATPAGEGRAPYFVMLGSLEPRKNHAMMLELWRRMAGHPRMPSLLVIGRRPSESHPGIALLDRGEFGGRVEDLGRVPDAALAHLLHGAQALLFPSLSEGYGIPLAEALAMGVPVLASDIPAFREVGGAVPDFLDPLDGPGWLAAILDYAGPDSLRRAAQLERLRGWRAPGWADHFGVVEPLLERLAAAPPASAGSRQA
ncbi:MAG TPA: glycosyltransferase family 1 protein [Roseococcus sp.]|jgi:glycosyltransferase involved in cell wall biosynthesis|nr:glycosyltransferase family 1 protein [Roseococcus sp.]